MGPCPEESERQAPFARYAQVAHHRPAPLGGAKGFADGDIESWRKSMSPDHPTRQDVSLAADTGDNQIVGVVFQGCRVS